MLAGCALHQPPSGANILTDAARAQIPGQWSGGHRSGGVVPNWISTFDDPELTRIVEEAVIYNPDLRAAAARVEASRAAVRVAAASLYPRIGAKILGEVQGQELGGDLARGIEPPSLGGIRGRQRRRQHPRHQCGFIIAARGLWPRNRRGVGS